ncbi:MAG: FapA family protein [bacterium]|nr:FapA family protein [bacterium]
MEKKIFSILNNRIGIEISEDETKAYLTLASSCADKMPVLDEVINALTELEIQNVLVNTVQDALENSVVNKPLLIARGISPTMGKDAFFIYQFGNHIEDRSIDVFPGQLLAVKRPPTIGRPGVSVTGKPIASVPGKDIVIDSGKNVFITNDGTSVFALEKGRVRWKGNSILVDDVMEVSGDVNNDVGNISFKGTVSVEGEVKDGITIHADGDININGNVGACTLESAGDITITGLVDGKGAARLCAEGDISVHSVRRAYIQAKKDVIVEKGIENSTVFAKNVRTNNGFIHGGEITASSGIIAQQIGSSEVEMFTDINLKDDAEVVCSHVYPTTRITMGEKVIEVNSHPEVDVKYRHVSEKQAVPVHTEREDIKQESLSSIHTGVDERVSKIFSTKTFSVLLRASSLLDAREIGARLLNLDPSEVDSQIVSMANADENTFLIRIFRLDTPGEWLKIEGERSVFDIHYDHDGHFEFMNTETGLFLTVSPSFGRGKRIACEDVLEYIEKHDVGEIDKQLTEKTVREALNIPVRVGKRKKVSNIDGHIRVEVLPTLTKALIHVVPPKAGGVPIQYKEVMEELRANGVVAGIKEDVIREIIDPNYRPYGPVTIAEETLPVQGSPAQIEFKFRTHKRIVLTEDEYGRVDFKSLNLIENVKSGQILAVKTPPGDGIPGRLVNGKETLARPGTDIKMPIGRNIYLAANNTQVRASMDGHVLLVGGKINVENTLIIPGNVDYSTGSIYFLGSVIVKGDVLDEFQVDATGDVLVHGCVGKCFISAGGSIAIGEGVKGKDTARLFAGQNVVAKYLEHAIVEAKEDVRVLEEILHSKVEAGNRVMLEGKRRGVIIGGLTRAGNEITTKELGCAAEVKTIVEVGGSPRTRQELAALQNIYQQEINIYEQLELNIAHLKKQKNTGKLSLEGDMKLQRLLWKHKKLTTRMERYTNQKEFLETRIKRAEAGVINVSGCLYPGVVVTTKIATMLTREHYQAVSLGFNGVGVGIYPFGAYREPIEVAE